MRLCRFQRPSDASPAEIEVGFYDETGIVPLVAAAELYANSTGNKLDLPAGDALLPFLPPEGSAYAATSQLSKWAHENDATVAPTKLDPMKVELKVPLANPNKLLLLAGNYAEHIAEGGGKAAERRETFPYVFMKPPSTTLVSPNQPIELPKVSPDHIDWEIELAVVIGKRCKHVSEAKALEVVAGYTVVNDISNRVFKPNPERRERPNDKFFDWLHGKWADGFAPCGPCIATTDSIPDPQALSLQLRVNETLHQDAATSQMIFPVAAIIEFISSFVTLEPGDIIATGTPAGVGNASGTYLRPGDTMEAFISSIGTLVTPVTEEK